MRLTMRLLYNIIKDEAVNEEATEIGKAVGI